jgi:hypothetical protein
MARYWKIAIAALAVIFVIGLMTLPALMRSVLRLQRAGVTDEQARREIARSTIATPSDVRIKAQLFWASAASPVALEATGVELPLSAEPVQRAKQLITALIAQAPTPAQRTLPADAELLGFYLLPQGVAVADFSETLGTETPSGILSEKLAVDSIVDTLGANMPDVHSLKILIHGQEADTLAGHLDLTGFFPVISPPPADTTTSPQPATPATQSAAAPQPPAASDPPAAPTK